MDDMRVRKKRMGLGVQSNRTKRKSGSGYGSGMEGYAGKKLLLK